MNIADATERREGVMAARVRGCDGSVEAEAAWQPAGPSRAGEGAGPAPRAGGPGLVRLPMEALRRACRGGGMYEVDFDATLTKPGVLHASLGSVVP